MTAQKLSFFRAINPLSNNSGIVASIGGRPAEELRDMTVKEYINRAWYQEDNTFAESIEGLSRTIMGKHFFNKEIDHRSFDGNKGLMDFLIFPLLARKLISNAIYNKEKNWAKRCLEIVGFVVGVILEIPRLIIGFALTGFLSPFAILINILEACHTRFSCAKHEAHNNDEPQLSI